MPSIQPIAWLAADVWAVILCAMTLAHLFRQRQEPGARSLSWLVVAVGVRAVLNLLMIASRDPSLAIFLARLIYVPQVVFPLAWLAFALIYTGQGEQLRRWPSVLVFALGGGTVLLALAGDPGNWLVTGGRLLGGGGVFGFVPEFGIWKPIHRGFSWGTIIFATGVLALHVAQSPRHVNRLNFVLGAPLLSAAGFLVPVLVPQMPIWANVQPLAQAFAAAALGWGLLSYGERAVAPVARNVVVEEMEDAVVVLDDRGRIVDVNRSAREKLSLRLLGPVPIELGATWASVKKRLGEPGMPVSERVDLPVAGGDTDTFEMSVTMLGPQAGRDRTVLVLRDITKQVQMERDLNRAKAALEELAHTDELTGIANRRQFLARLEKEVDRSRRYGRPLSLVLLDLDHFKTVNDSHGHAMGDLVLQATAREMEGVSRDLDLPGRMGGEEFGLLLPETDAGGARTVADRLRLAIGRRMHEPENGEPFRVTASVGVVTLEPGTEWTLEQLIQRADEFLYRAKERGRNRVEAGSGGPTQLSTGS